MKKISLIFSAVLMSSAMQHASAWSYGPYPYAFQQWHSGPQFTTGFQIQQYSAPDGYHIHIASKGRSIDEINIRVEGRSFAISSQRGQEQQRQDQSGRVRMMQSGSFSQWIALPMDADMQSMRRRQSPGMIEIFVPRFR